MLLVWPVDRRLPRHDQSNGILRSLYRGPGGLKKDSRYSARKQQNI